MTREELTLGNILIAKFMGFTFDDNSNVIEIDSTVSAYTNENWTDLLFHKSWDWLIPVIQKFYELGFYITINPTGILIQKDVYTNWQYNFINGFCIESIWKGIYSFIELYNSGEIK